MMLRVFVSGVALGLALFLLGGSAQAQAAAPGTLLDAARALQSGAQALAQRSAEASPQPTWGQSQAREDLVALASAAAELAAAMESGDPAVTARSLQDATTRLDVARNRVKMSLPLLGLEDASTAGAPLLEQAGRLSTALRQVDNRFLGRAQASGSHLGAVKVDEAGAPLVYGNPEALLREARGIRSSAEQMLASYRYDRGACGPGGVPLGPGSAFEYQDLRDLLRAAWVFEDAAGSRYQDVEATRRAYSSLRRAALRALPYWGGSFGNFAAWDLERALRRLDAFYRQAER